MRLLSWFAAAVLVALALLPGTLVEGVSAGRATPSPSAASNQQVDSDPTPTPESTPTPTPTPTPESTPTPQATPTPTPAMTPTPTPEKETFAQITALTFIDPDGDPTTNNGHVFDDRWDFEGEFGAAEVHFAVPYSDWLESAVWDISYTADTPIVITALPGEGYTQRDVSCVASPNPNGWQVDGTSVSWLAPTTGGEPVSLHCAFTQAPSPTPIEEAVGAINAYPVLDQDGDATTHDDWLQLPSWEFAADFGPAQIDVAHPVADELGVAWWYITFRNNTPIEITELVPDGYRLAEVQCGWAPDEETIERLPLKRRGNSVSWNAFVGTSNYHDFWCTFVNVVEGTTALPTLPPTDAAAGSAVVGSDAWRLVLVGFAAIVVGALVRGPQRTIARRL
jgi:hypothetical protein